MAHLIDKDALVSEIKRKLKELSKHDAQQLQSDIVEQMVYNEMISFINTLKMKEVDLEDNIKESLAQEYVNYIFKRHDIDPESKEGQLIYYAYMHGINQCLTQLRAQKGE